MKRRHLPIALAVLAAACSTSTNDADAEIDEPFTRVIVTAGSGDVVIQQTTRTPEWSTQASHSGELTDYAPRVVNGELIVDEACDGLTSCFVDYVLLVPEGTEVVAHTGSGDVTIVSISAAVDVSTASGVVFLNTVKGAITVETNSGDILGTKLEAAHATFVSSTGNVDVAFELIISELIVDTGTGNVTAQLAGGPYNLDASTGSGSIDFKVDDDDTATNFIMLKTGSGDLIIYKQ